MGTPDITTIVKRGAYQETILVPLKEELIIYIIITKNIRYLLWNQGLWHALNNTYPIFLTPCIRCTNHLCDSCDLTDVNRHFIPSLLRMVQNVDLLWRHRYKSRSPAIVTSEWPIVPAWLLWMLSYHNDEDSDHSTVVDWEHFLF